MSYRRKFKSKRRRPSSRRGKSKIVKKTYRVSRGGIRI